MTPDLLAQVGAIQTVLVAQLLRDRTNGGDDVRTATVQEPLLTVDELSEILKVSKPRVYELIRRGRFTQYAWAKDTSGSRAPS